MKVAVIGANGQLGHDILEVFAQSGDLDLLPLTHADVEITDPASVARALAGGLEVVINTAAFHVGQAEANVAASFRVNAEGPKVLADHCAAHGVDLIHISTDYVFGGESDVGAPKTSCRRKPYEETAPTHPVSVYGISKLAGELLVRSFCGRSYIVRVCGLYGVAGCRGKGGVNFVEVMLRKAAAGEPLHVVNDQICTPSYTKDVAEGLGRLVRTRRYGVYHLTNAGQCSWYEFAAEIFRLAGLRPALSPVTTAELGDSVRRPAYSVLSNCKWVEAGLKPLRPWRQALAAYLEERKSKACSVNEQS